jgi:PiT family inorganic phosphate transporter
MLTLVVFIIVVALAFDFLNGFHDAANSIATIVSTRVLSPVQAVAWAALFNFIAAFTFGTHVANTIAKGLVDPNPHYITVWVVLSGLTGAIIWNITTWLLALPTSSSHALVSAMAGAAIAHSGLKVILWGGWVPLLAFIVLSPLIGFLLGATNMIVAAWIFRRSTPRKVDNLFRRLQLLSAAVFSLGHGGNDSQKTMGIIVLVLSISGHQNWASGKFSFWGWLYHFPRIEPHLHWLSHTHNIAPWIILSCNGAIALGTMFGGWRIVKTMGSGITRLTPVGGFCAELSAAVTIIGSTFGGIPISTTHAITGAILGVGTTRGVRSVRWIWGQRIVLAWVLTIPCSALIAALTYLVIRTFLGILHIPA